MGQKAELSPSTLGMSHILHPTPYMPVFKVSYFIQGEIRLVNLPQRVSQEVEHEFLYLKGVCSPELLQNPERQKALLKPTCASSSQELYP